MDKKTIIGLVLIFAVFIGFYYLNAPTEAEIQARKHQQDSICALATERMEKEKQLKELAESNAIDSLSKMRLLQASDVDDSIKQTILLEKQSRFGAFTGATVGEEREIVLSNEDLSISISTLGGRISAATLKEYLTYGKEPVALLQKETSEFSFNLSVGSRIVPTSALYFVPYINGEPCFGEDTLRVTGNDSIVLSMRAYAEDKIPDSNQSQDQERYLEFTYVMYGSGYLVGFNSEFHHLNTILSDRNFLEVVWQMDLQQQEKDRKVERNNSSIYYAVDGDVDYLKEGGRDDKEEISGTRIDWVGYKQQFFSSVILAKGQPFMDARMETITPNNSEEQTVCTMNSLLTIPFDHEADLGKFDMEFYFGPNKYAVFSSMDKGLEEMIPLGWGFFLLQWVNRFVVIPVFDFLNQFGWSYGIIILVLTLLVKLVLFPLTYKSYASSAKMRVIQPEVTKLNEKYPKREQAMQKQQAVMALYKRAGINPMGGCLPLLLQFPILVAMFRFFPASIELRQQGFLWADDLSSYDSILNLPFTIPFYGGHVSLFCLLMTIAQLFYTRMTMKQQSQTNAMPGMKFMMYFMPIMMLFFLNNYSAALNYYYFLSLCITFLQTWIVRRTVNEDAIRERLERNTQKAVVKPSWQKRYEKMQAMNKNLEAQRARNRQERRDAKKKRN